jgi:hypothetical protein
MTMQSAANAFIAATTAEDIRAAYDAMVECLAADEDLPDDADFRSGVDDMLNKMGLPSLADRLLEIAA